MKIWTLIDRKLEWIAAAIVVAAISFAAVIDGQKAQAQQAPPNPTAYVPEVRVGTAASVPIATAVAYYNSIAPASDPATVAPSTCDANAGDRSPYVRELARSLPADADETFKYVHDNVTFSATFGLKKGAAGAVLDGDGTAADHAHVLVELLRANGFCARYVFGTAEATLAQIQTWIGVDDLESAERVFADGGIPVERTATTLRFAHVWVELYGASGTAVYDPSFKRRKPSTPAVDVAAAVGITDAGLRTALGGTGDVNVNRVFASTGGVDSYLTDKAQALAMLLYKNQQPVGLPASMQSTDYATLSFENVLGIGETLPYGATPVTAAIRQPLAYTQTHQTWYEVPERFKAIVQIHIGRQTDQDGTVTQAIDRAMPMEKAANGRLEIRSTFAGSPGPSAETGTGRIELYFDEDMLASSGDLPTYMEHVPWFVTIFVDMPYAAAATGESGKYGDTIVMGRVDARSYSTLFATSGRTSTRRLRELSRLPRKSDRLSRAYWQSGSPALNAQLCPVHQTGIGGTGSTYIVAPRLDFNCGYKPPSFPTGPNDLQSNESQFTGGSSDPDTCSTGSYTLGLVGSIGGGLFETQWTEWQSCAMLDIINMTPISVESVVDPTSVYFSSGSRLKAQAAIDWQVDNTQTRIVSAALSGTVSEAHAVVGFVTSSVEVDGYTNVLVSDTLRLHAEPVISVNTRSNLASAAQAAARKTMVAVYSAASAAAEGLVLRAATQQPFATSVTDKFRWSVDFDPAQTSGGNLATENFRNVSVDPEGRFLRITPQQFAQVGAAIWDGTVAYPGSAKKAIEGRLAEGYIAIIPKFGTLGPEMSPQQRRYRPAEYSDLEYYMSVYKNGAAAVLLIDPNSGAVSHLVVSGMDGVFKGGSSAPELKANSITRPSPDGNKAAEEPWSKLYQVDDRDGRLTFTLPGDISLGTDDAGLKLALTYQSELAASNRMSNGWVSNFKGWATLNSASSGHFGLSRPVHAAAMLTTLSAATKLLTTSNDIDAIVGTEVAMGWWTNQLMFSNVTIAQGTEQFEFFRAPNGSFLAETPRGGELKQTGAITIERMVKRFTDPEQPGFVGPGNENALSISFRYETGVNFAYRSAEGEIRKFVGTSAPPFGLDPDDAPILPVNSPPPQGPQCEPTSTFCTDDPPAPQGNFALSEIRTQCPPGAIDNVSLCAGRTITVGGTNISDDLGNNVSSLFITPKNGTATDAGGRQVEFIYASRAITDGTTGDMLTAVRLKDSSGAIVWEYKFSYINAHGPGVTTEFRPLLEKVWFPHDHVNPYVTFAYTADDRIDSVTRAGNKVYDYLATGHRTEVRDPTGAAAISYFDANGRLFHSVDRLGRLNEFTHDGAGRVIEKRLRMTADPQTVYSERATFENDLYDNVTEATVFPRTDSAGTPMGSTNVVRKAEFTNANWPLAQTKSIDALNRAVVNTFDAYGRATRVDGAQGERIDTTYDAKGFPTSVQTYVSPSVYRALDFDYTAGGQPHRGLIREARVYSSAAPSVKLTSSFAWDATGNLTQASDARGNAKTASYDAARRMTDFREYVGPSTGALASRQSFTYDPSGRITQVSRAKDAGSAAWATTSATYTATGRIAKIVDPDLDEDNFAYDERDWLTSATDGEGRVTAYAYDAGGRLTCEKRGVGTALAQGYRSLAYGIFDKLARLRPAKGSDAACATASAAYDTIYAFDEYGRDKTTTFADGTTTQATLNVASELTALKTRANQTLGYSYDASSRETARTTPQGAYVFAYDREGKRTSAAFTPSGEAARATTYGYDHYGRVTTEGRHDGRNIQYEYDDAGNRTAIVWPDNYRAEYVYDALNRPVEVKAGPAGSLATIARYSYDFLGRRTQLAFGPTAGSPVSSLAYGYEDDNDLVRLEHRFDSGALVKVIRHAYDKSGKLKSSAANDSAWAPVQPAGTRTYAAANVLDQYTTVTDGSTATLAYDQNGNLTGDGAWTFAYDAENRLTSANKVGATVTYTYDALGRRQTKTVNGTLTNYLSAGDEEIAEYDASGNMLRRYIPGPGTDQPVAMVAVSGAINTLRFFHADRQGSVVAMADATGALVEGPYTYDPYGNSANSSAGVPFRYTGRRLDAETGLYYYRARYYSASMGRFLQTDPVGYQDQMNLYAYVGNDPTNNTDPTGKTCLSLVLFAVCRVSDGTTSRVYFTSADQAADPINTRPAGSTINQADKPGEGDGQFGSSRAGGTRTHEGTDFQGNVSDPVVAAGDGVVTRADGNDVNGYGNQVIIAHGGNNEDLYTQYAHLDTINVQVGDTVRAGDIIGTMGRTGNTPSQGDTHAHVELREGPSSRDTVRDIEPELPP